MHLGREFFDIVIVHFHFQYFVTLFADILQSLDHFFFYIQRSKTEVFEGFSEIGGFKYLFLLVFIDILFGPWLLTFQLDHAKILIIDKPIVFLLNSL